jgi:hypothetical protein
MRKKLNESDKKVKLTTTINPKLYNIIYNRETNLSKYIEKLVYNDLIKNNEIETFYL